ncbi:MAG: radical SAM protein [Candidatus Omnitrophica bacterium]|nr:radical SAM protein [Candidatus Omnitrophota bacterium]
MPNFYASLLGFLENGPKTRVYESRPLLNLDDIPLPNVDLLKGFYIHRTPFTIMTARGCNYNCTFCLDKKYRPGTVRYHSCAYVCDLLEILIKSFNLENFLIGDDIFTINKGRVIEICREIRKRSLKVNLSAFTHVGIDDLELYKEMRGAGFTGLIIGIESACDEVLRAMNKQQTVAEIRKTIDIIKEAGLNVSVLFMVGNILETEKSLNASLELANELKSRGCAGWVSYAQPFPGTKFYELCPKYGKLINKNPKEYWNDRMVFIPDGISRSKLKFYRNKIAIAFMAPLPWTTRAMYKLP